MDRDVFKDHVANIARTMGWTVNDIQPDKNWVEFEVRRDDGTTVYVPMSKEHFDLLHTWSDN